MPADRKKTSSTEVDRKIFITFASIRITFFIIIPLFQLMREKIDCFVPCADLQYLDAMLADLRQSKTVQHIHLLVDASFSQASSVPEDCSLIVIDHLRSSDTLRSIALYADADYTLVCMKLGGVQFGMSALERFLRVASDANAAMVYSDHYTLAAGELSRHPVIDYQEGSVRDDFDFGSAILFDTQLLHNYVSESKDRSWRYAAWYDLRLYLSRKGTIFHLNEYLYTEEETDLRASGEKQFDYVNPSNVEVQQEMERVVTSHLEAIGALVDTTSYSCPDFNEQDFPVEASVIIPVRNRVRTIADAVRSALAQQTTFDYNVIVVDNLSDDGTTELLRNLVAEAGEQRLIHLIPTRHDLGIGGCWNMAVNHEHCGRFAVQLDSDDLYSSPHTLQAIVDAFHQQRSAMVIGSYRMCDFELGTLPPGLIAHKEWTDENGPNNALRINGLGAPRAFFTPLLRQIQFPNTSYGEDYALGLIFSRRYRIGRIYDELYLCRRWEGNSDARLSVEKQNANNLYKDRLRTLEISARRQMRMGKEDIMTDSSLQRFFNRQLEQWESARTRYRDLQQVETKPLALDTFTITAQHNPARIVSTGASVDKQSLANRPCFLCESNRPAEQMKKVLYGGFELLVNPFPILPIHFTIVKEVHVPQRADLCFDEIYQLLTDYPDLMVFYNGPKCGASAPDHAHLQAGTSGMLPLQSSWQRLSRSLTPLVVPSAGEGIYTVTDYPCPALLIAAREREQWIQLFSLVYKTLPTLSGDSEPMLNIVAWRGACPDMSKSNLGSEEPQDTHLAVIFPRGKHRPDCYYADDEHRLLVSPGALDMAGLFILPRRSDFERITPQHALDILREVAISQEQMGMVEEHLVNIAHSNKEAEKAVLSYENEPEVKVGIVSAERISFTLNAPYMAKGDVITGGQEVAFSEGGILWNGNHYRELTFVPQTKHASFSLKDVTIGINFHWERKETQVFSGMLKLVVDADRLIAINQLPVEDYLMSVISSEMSATSSMELLKAHAVISRSWLLAQMERRRAHHQEQNSFFSFVKKDDELIRWYDREDHTLFDVCADDHCQRYQGITKQVGRAARDAVASTRGQILVDGDEICDARFSKCCGGITEEYQYCWEDTSKPYLLAVRDMASSSPLRPMTEAEAEAWIRSTPDAFCHTRDHRILSQVLNDYDQETVDFYRWRVEYTQEELSQLISEKQKDDFGAILDLVAVERGKSGRISKLKIVGSKKTLTIGKELEIRRTLSQTHLYSSAFVVDKGEMDNGVPQRFVLLGAGWGHGVGLCQIGAAVMGEQGYPYNDILLHYYRGAQIKSIY